MRTFVNMLATTALITAQLASTAPALAQIGQNKGQNGGTRQARPAPQNKGGGNFQKPQGGGYQKPAGGNGFQKPANMGQGSNFQKPAGGNFQKPAAGNFQKPATGNFQKPATGNFQKPATKDIQRPNNINSGNTNWNNNKYNAGNKNNINNNYNNNKANFNGNKYNNNNVNINNSKNVVVAGNNRYGAYNPGYYRPPVNRPPGWYAPGYRPPGYRPPGWYPPPGGYWGPPVRPVGGWGYGFYPPPRYYYQNDTTFGEVFAGVLVAGSLVALLSAATAPKPPQTVYVQGQPAPPPEPPPMYQPPPQSSGGPAAIKVDFQALTPDARPSASTCMVEAARQIGATGGTEISVHSIDDVEQGNGGFRFRIALNAVYPDTTRVIPMYCRATPEKIIELTFG